MDKETLIKNKAKIKAIVSNECDFYINTTTANEVVGDNTIKTIFDGEEYLGLETKPYNYRGFGYSKNYILCKDCLKKFKDFMNGCEVVAP